MKKFIKNLHPSTIIKIFLALLMIGNLLSPLEANAVTFDKDFAESNDIYFFDPTDTCATASASGSTSSSAPTSLTGSDNEEKIWNYYASRGLTPIAIAGIMGNFSQEDSQFDPAEKQNQSTLAIPDDGDGLTGFGIAQWTSQGRQAGLFAAMRAAGVGEYYGAGWGASEKDKEIPSSNPDDLDTLLLTELNYSWSGDSVPISGLASQLNDATSVDTDTGSTVIFHDNFEISADDAAKIQQRINDAESILSKYSTSSTGCLAALNGVSSLSSAVAWANKFVSDTLAQYPSVKKTSNATSVGTTATKTVVYQFAHSGGSCWKGSNCGECTALSGWFVTNMTGYTYGSGNGNEVVANLAKKGVPTGTTPEPFSVFSFQGPGAVHTGVVLGVLSNGSIITLEDNAENDGKVTVSEYSSVNALVKSQYPDGNSVIFAYVGDKLSSEATALEGGQS